MKISERFKLNKTQHELDFVDVDTDLDFPLFLDPYFIAKNDFPIASEAHSSLRSYFKCLLSALKEGRMREAEELFSHLGETNEICLGFSQTKPQGKGMGPSDASRIFKSLKESHALKTGIMEDIEDFRIFVDNVDKDKMSDMTANIIKKHLIEYTQAQCAVWGIPLTHDTPSGYYWERETNTWENKYTDMLIVDDRKILLIPKRIVSFSTEYTPQKYKQHFVLNFLQNEQLKLNGPLVQKRKDQSEYVTKKSVCEYYGQERELDKKWLAEFTEKHPEVFSEFRQNTKSRISPISNSEITTEPIDKVCNFLSEQLKSTPSGRDDATKYHRLIVGILELLFYPNLCNPVIEQDIHEGRKRIDITFDNCSETGFFFRLSTTLRIPSQFIMIECKNYSRDVANPELDQIGGRFSPARGQVGIIACRSADDMSLLLSRCSDTYKDSRGLIIPLVDKDIYELLNYKAQNNESAIDSFLQKRFHSIAMT
ncbi:MAG: hypothetical protein J6K17_00570 [Oscillospiraceae bacterium]|nr:hypothetical protein [Oscillospiraceae bacterium]